MRYSSSGFKRGVQTGGSMSQKLRQRHPSSKKNFITKVSRLRFYRDEILRYSKGGIKGGLKWGVQTVGSMSQKLRQRHPSSKKNFITKVSRLRFYRDEIMRYSNGGFKGGVEMGGSNGSSMSQKLRQRHSSIVREMSSLESVV